MPNPGIEDHHDDVVHSVHRALLEAENKWVIWNDDDDEILGDRRSLLEDYAEDDVAVIYGDVIANRGGGSEVPVILRCPGLDKEQPSLFQKPAPLRPDIL